ncbi:MAG: ROK family protein [Christensenellales bacterium]
MNHLKVPAPLDPGFQPLSLALRDYQADVAAAGVGVRLVCAVERGGGYSSPWEMAIFPDGVETERTLLLMERVIKSLLWMRGGHKVKLSGSQALYHHIRAVYAKAGARSFDEDYMAGVFEQPFQVAYYEDPQEIATAVEAKSEVGRHLDGCRIGFDAGGSDRKVSAVIDGESVFSQEVVWFPKVTADPNYHYEGIVSALRTAASHLPRVDAIGVSSAGVYINNRTMAASLFLSVSREDFDKSVKDIYIRAAREIGEVPLEVANDGDVTALAGAMNLGAGRVLGIAMGTSEAGGYVDQDMHIMGWLNELAFVPIDLNPEAMVDEWSGDRGCGVKYFSQDGVIKLAPAAGIPLDEALSPAEKLKIVQEEMRRGNPGARSIYETLGVNFGYALAYYALFYDIDHVLIMGRVTSGEGGTLLLAKAQEVLDLEFPDLARRISLNIPDEAARRVGQSVAAASLPQRKQPDTLPSQTLR